MPRGTSDQCRQIQPICTRALLWSRMMKFPGLKKALLRRDGSGGMVNLHWGELAVQGDRILLSEVQQVAGDHDHVVFIGVNIA